MARIGIITCSNMTNDLACSSFGCLEDSHAGKGTFARYADQGGAQVVGVISCSGCPTLIAPEKILRRVRTLAASGVDAIHFAYRMEHLCPFQKKYQSILEAEFPDISFVKGTHTPLDEKQAAMMSRFVHDGLCHCSASMAYIAESRQQREQKA